MSYWRHIAVNCCQSATLSWNWQNIWVESAPSLFKRFLSCILIESDLWKVNLCTYVSTQNQTAFDSNLAIFHNLTKDGNPSLTNSLDIESSLFQSEQRRSPLGRFRSGAMTIENEELIGRPYNFVLCTPRYFKVNKFFFFWWATYGSLVGRS